jgi:hypothetical protein
VKESGLQFTAFCNGSPNIALDTCKENSDQEMESEYKQKHKIVYNRILKDKLIRHLNIEINQ